MGTVRITSSQSSPTVTFQLEADVVEVDQANRRWKLRMYLRASKSSGSYYGNAGSQVGYINGQEFGRHTGHPFLPSASTGWYDGPWEWWLNANSAGYWTGTSTTLPLAMLLQYGNVNTTPGGSIELPRIAALPPSAPRNLGAGSPDTGQLQAWWVEPSSNGGSPITQYDLAYSGNGGASWTEVHGVGSGHIIYGLTPGGTYAVIVRARNADAIGPWSAHVNARLIAAQPSAPRNIQIAPTGSRQLSCWWDAPSYNGGIDGWYALWLYGTSAGTQQHYFERIGQSYLVTGLVPGGVYDVRVRFVNNDGKMSDYTMPIAATVIGDPPTAPRNLAAVSTTPGQVTLTWDDPESTGGKPIWWWQLEWSLSPTMSGSTQINPSSAHAHTLTGLAPGAIVYARVRCGNQDNPGAWTGIVSVQVLSGLYASDGAEWDRARPLASTNAAFASITRLRYSNGSTWLDPR